MHDFSGEISTFGLTGVLLCMYSCAANQLKLAEHSWKRQASLGTMHLSDMQQGLLDSLAR